MDSYTREELQLLVNSMGDVVKIGFAKTVDPVRLVTAWKSTVEGLLNRDAGKKKNRV